MDLDLTIPHARGRQAAEVSYSYLRDLDENDVLILQSGVDMKSETPALQKLRSSHHKMAELLAAGLKDIDVSLITGYSQSRISILKNDPAFRELLTYYSAAARQASVDVIQRAREIGIDTLEVIHERIVGEKADDLTMPELVKVAELTLDRAGFGAKSTVKHEHGMSAEMLEAIRRAEDEKRGGRVIEAEVYSQSGVGDRDSRPGIRRQEAEALEFKTEGPGVRGEGREALTEKD